MTLAPGSSRGAQGGWRTIMQREVDAYFLNASNDAGPLRPSGGGTFDGTPTSGRPGAHPLDTGPMSR